MGYFIPMSSNRESFAAKPPGVFLEYSFLKNKQKQKQSECASIELFLLYSYTGFRVNKSHFVKFPNIWSKNILQALNLIAITVVPL